MSQTLDIPLLAYPTLTESARLLSVSASTLSRRGDLECERMGERDKRISAREVMRLAAIYRKRSLGEVAADLVARAQQGSPAYAEHVEEEIERFFEDRSSSIPVESGFLEEAKRALPADLYEQVRQVYETSLDGKRPALVSAAR